MSPLAERFEKAPRWFLSIVLSGLIGTVGVLFVIVTNGVAADVKTAKETSLLALSKADSANKSIEYMSSTLDETQVSLNKLAEKYDRNQEENQRVFRQILAAVKS